MRILLDEKDLFILICVMAASVKKDNSFSLEKRDSDFTNVQLFERAREDLEVVRYKQTTY